MLGSVTNVRSREGLLPYGGRSTLYTRTRLLGELDYEARLSEKSDIRELRSTIQQEISASVPKEQAKFEVKNRIIEIAMAVLPDTAAL